jgi:hypothetical protein
MYDHDLANDSKVCKTYKILKNLSVLILELFSKNITEELILNIQVKSFNSC